eukprot:CFRG5200T1
MSEITHSKGLECACTNIRTCALCEHTLEIRSAQFLAKKIPVLPQVAPSLPTVTYVWCLECELAHRESTLKCTSTFPHNPPDDLTLTSVAVFNNIISEDEETQLVRDIDQSPWKTSQSGRRKQEYGPTVNFKKKKINLKKYTGLPRYIKFLTAKMADIPLLFDFVAVEQGNLEYTSARGSANDAHIDDEWAWGERLCTLTLMQDCWMTFEKDFTLAETDAMMFDITKETHRTRFCGFVSPPLQSQGISIHTLSAANAIPKRTTKNDMPSVDNAWHAVVNVKLPRRSMIVSQGVMRHQWTHAILRKNIVDRRISVTLRELGQCFLPGQTYEEIGSTMLELASKFQGTCV